MLFRSGDDCQFSIRQIVEIIADEMDHKLEIVNLPAQAAYPARGVSLEITAHHKLLDLHKIKQQLGYSDPVPPEEALRRTTRWYIEHQPERGGDLEQRLQDFFDYDAEDQLAAIYREAAGRARAFRRETAPTPHPYPHPKEPNLQRDHRNR